MNGKRIVLVRSGDGYSAFDDHCTHRGASLADGVVISGTVQCPWHGSQFDVRTGKVLRGTGEAALFAYQVEVRGRDVVLHVAGSASGGPGRAA